MLDHEPYVENSSDTLLTKNDKIIGSTEHFLENDKIITIKNSQENQVLTVAPGVNSLQKEHQFVMGVFGVHLGGIPGF